MIHTVLHAVLEEPTLLFLIALLPSILALRVVNPNKRLAASCGILGIALFAALGLLNLGRPGFIWHDEPSILAVSAAFLHGEPLYHARSAPALYSLLYGPATFLVYLPLLRASQHPLPLIRWFQFAVYLADGILLYRILRSRVPAWIALALLATPLAILLSSASHAFGIRGDSVLLLCLCIGLLSIELRTPIAAALLCGLAGGAAVDFKLTVAPVVLLLFALLLRRHGLRALWLSTATALLAAGMPFAFHLVSLRNYLDWLLASGHQGFDPSLLKANLLCALLMLAPGALLRLFNRHGTISPRREAYSVWIGSLFVVALACCIVTGAKNGAGPWHLWPMLPLAALWSASEAERANRNTELQQKLVPLITAIAFASTVLIMRLSYRDLAILHPKDHAAQAIAETAAEDELAGIVSSHPGRTVEMGYGRDVADYRSSLRFELPLQGNDYFLDEDAFVELIKGGTSPSTALTNRILSCGNLWLIPHGAQPFETLRKGVLPDTATPYLFPDAVRLYFAQTHSIIESDRYYDLWACPATSPVQAPTP